MAAKNQHNQVDDMLSSGKSALKTARRAKKAYKMAKAAAIPGLNKILLIGGLAFLIIFLFVIPSVSSLSQMDSVLHYSALGEEEINMPDAEELEDSLWNKEKAQEYTVELLNIIQKKKEKDKEKQHDNVSAFCAANNYDAALSWSHLRKEYEVAYVNDAASNSNETTQSFSMTTIFQSRKTSYPLVNADTDKNATAESIFQSEKTYIDENGFYRYRAVDGDDDYIVAMGSYYGKAGSRYKLTFEDGRSITLLKAYDVEKKKTVDGKGQLPNSGGFLQMLVDSSSLPVSLRESRDASLLSTFSETEKLELVESELAAGSATAATGADNRILAAFSVYLNNAQLEKDDKLGRTEYYNQKGGLIDKVWFWEGTDEIDYDSVLDKKLDEFMEKDSFYILDYVKENGQIKVDYEVTYKDITVKDPATGENVIDEATGEAKTETVEERIYYVYPILIERDINSIAEEVFGIDPDDAYINSGGLYEEAGEDSGMTNENTITNREAINNIAQSTSALLFNQTFTSDQIIFSELSGEYEWPVPSSSYVSSPYGMRIHPVYGIPRMHTGVDIACSEGSPVVAAGDGTVTFVGWYGGYGKFIKIDHGNGIVTAYAHLSAYGVQKGQNVAKGQVIAKSGNTGTSTGGHLHFEVIVNGSTENPLQYITTAETYNNLTIAGKS